MIIAKMKKRGVSPVIATAILVTITVAAVVIVARFAIPFVKDNLEESTKCVNYKSYFQIESSLEKGVSCKQTSGGEVYYGISIRSSGSEELAKNVEGIKLVLIETGESKVVSITNGSAPSLEVGGVWMFKEKLSNIELPNRGEMRSYVYRSGGEGYSTLEVYPILKGEKICERTDSVKLTFCKTGTDLTS